MKIALILLAALAAAFLLAYLLAPGALIQWGRKLQRGRGGLTEKSVRVGDFTWPFLEGGNPAGKPLVLIHGFGGDKDNWSFYAPYIK
jgi:abhydrolase domain-containing protein 6